MLLGKHGLPLGRRKGGGSSCGVCDGQARNMGRELHQIGPVASGTMMELLTYHLRSEERMMPDLWASIHCTPHDAACHTECSTSQTTLSGHICTLCGACSVVGLVTCASSQALYMTMHHTSQCNSTHFLLLHWLLWEACKPGQNVWDTVDSLCIDLLRHLTGVSI